MVDIVKPETIEAGNESDWFVARWPEQEIFILPNYMICELLQKYTVYYPPESIYGIARILY